MKLIQACLGARKDGERSFHHCGGLVKLVHGCFCARKDGERNFHDCESAVKFLQACVNIRKIEKAVFITVYVLGNTCSPV